MHREIEEFVRRNDLPPDEAAALEALISRHAATASAVTTVLADHAAVTLVDEDTEPAAPADEKDLVSGRYADLGPIGLGGMGEVRRVRDVALNRTLAMKTVHTALLERHATLARFLDEAQATAQLQHPNIVPVHDIGTHPDGRIWFTMKEVRGQPLTQVIRDVHAASSSRWTPAPSGWTFRQTITAFLAVCHAIAYANERGVVHRDLKPENVMVRPQGEVYVIDWGLAKLVGRHDRDDDLETREHDLKALLAAEHTVVTSRSPDNRTRMGSVAGTPAYMAPEQARGHVDAIDARTDVYALGAILYEILSGRPPYQGRDAMDVLRQVLAGPPAAIGPHQAQSTFGFGIEVAPTDNGPPLPVELVEICNRAMARDAADRYPSAVVLAKEVEAWLDGAHRREQAMEITQRALAQVDEARKLREQAAALQAEGDALLEGIESWRPEQDKAPGWAKQDQAAALHRQAELKQLEVDQGLHGALRVAPDLPEAHGALAERYLSRHATAESDRDGEQMARMGVLVRLHADALPPEDPVRQRCAAYLKGDGAVTLVTDPPGAEVMLHRYEERNRRLVEVPVRSLGTTPLREVSLPMGSYLAVIRHPDRPEVRYPLQVPRQGHWDGVAPGDREPTPVWLPPEGYLGADEVYIPAGWFWSGGDPLARNSHPPRRLWCDALVVQRFPVTNRQYIAFLDDLVMHGKEGEALRYAPRERPGQTTQQGALIYGFDGRRFELAQDADGDLWLPDWPVFQVDALAAQAYLTWLNSHTGRAWRLPREMEWEKAASGVDGRAYPWGDFCDPSWTCTTKSHRDTRLPSSVGCYPVDSSPYGVRGMGGNAQDWCLDMFDDPFDTEQATVVPPSTVEISPDSHLVTRGGAWMFGCFASSTGARGRNVATNLTSHVSFRGLFRPPIEP